MSVAAQREGVVAVPLTGIAASFNEIVAESDLGRSLP